MGYNTYNNQAFSKMVQNFIRFDGNLVGSLIRDLNDGVYYMGIEKEDGTIKQARINIECSNPILDVLTGDSGGRHYKVSFKGYKSGFQESVTHELATYRTDTEWIDSLINYAASEIIVRIKYSSKNAAWDEKIISDYNKKDFRELKETGFDRKWTVEGIKK